MPTPPASAVQRAAGAFVPAAETRAIAPLGGGLINDTFLVTLTSGQRLVLQRINRRAFPQPERILANLRTLLAHAARPRAGGTPALRLPALVPTRDGRDWFVDSDNDFWRALSYIEHSATHTRIADAAQAAEVGRALGQFHALVHDLPAERLHVTRPGFHQTPRYYARLEEVAARTGREDAPALAECLAFVRARAAIVNRLEDARQQGLLPLRIVHGDPKVENFLFDATSGVAVSLIDLDTVQPGLVHYDLGDCLRSACNPAGESPDDPAAAHFDVALCRALLAGYFEHAGALLSEAELRYLPEAIRLIPFELGMRFLTDHLQGDAYFKVAWRGHNLQRARTQFMLTASIEQQLDAIRALVAQGAR